MSVLRSTPNHWVLKHRCPIKISNGIRPAYLTLPNSYCYPKVYIHNFCFDYGVVVCCRCAGHTEQGWARSCCMTLVMCFWRLQSCASIPAMRRAQVCSLAYSSSRGYFFVSSSSPSGLSGASGRKMPFMFGKFTLHLWKFLYFPSHNITKPHAP